MTVDRKIVAYAVVLVSASVIAALAHSTPAYGAANWLSCCASGCNYLYSTIPHGYTYDPGDGTPSTVYYCCGQYARCQDGSSTYLRDTFSGTSGWSTTMCNYIDSTTCGSLKLKDGTGYGEGCTGGSDCNGFTVDNNKYVSGTPVCSYSVANRIDHCSSTCTISDDACKSSCPGYTGSAACDGKNPGDSCETGNNKCTDNCACTVKYVSLTANPSSVPANGVSTSTITAQTSDGTSSKIVSFSTTMGTLSASSCTTGGAGSCTVTIKSPSVGSATVTGTSSDYASGATGVSFSSTCNLISASVAANCGGGASSDCEAGETVTMSGTYSGDCSAADFFQIDARSADATCDIQYTGGSMSGIWDSSITLSGGTVGSAVWTIPTIAASCLGKTVSAQAAALWNGVPGTGTWIDGAETLSGSFKFAAAVGTTTTLPATTTTTTTTTLPTTTTTTTTLPQCNSLTLNPASGAPSYTVAATVGYSSCNVCDYRGCVGTSTPNCIGTLIRTGSGTFAAPGAVGTFGYYACPGGGYATIQVTIPSGGTTTTTLPSEPATTTTTTLPSCTWLTLTPASGSPSYTVTAGVSYNTCNVCDYQGCVGTSTPNCVGNLVRPGSGTFAAPGAAGTFGYYACPGGGYATIQVTTATTTTTTTTTLPTTTTTTSTTTTTTDTPPSCSISSITESSPHAYSSGAAVWYNTLGTGNFVVNANANDDKGVSKVNFPNTVSNGGDDASSPYSWTYGWDATDTYSSVATVTAYDTASQTGTCTFTVTKDTAAPTTTASVTGSYTITLTCMDNAGGSGCYQTKYCTDTTDSCSPTTVYVSPLVQSCADKCYVRYYSTDNVANQEAAKSMCFGPDCSCTRVSPSVSISPSSQSGTAGSTLTYTATVTNNDNAACGSSTFGLTYSCQSGWTCLLGPASLTISPGSSSTSTFSVTSSSSATAGDYTVSATATNNGATSYTGTGSATYTVTLPTTTTTTLPGQPFQLVIKPGWNLLSVPYRIVSSVQQDDCGAATGNFYFYNATTGKWDVNPTVGITNFKVAASYWFYSNESCSVVVLAFGDVAAGDITLSKNEWNHVGAPRGGMNMADMGNARCWNCGGSKCGSMKVLYYDTAASQFKDATTIQEGVGYRVQCIGS